MNKIRQGLADDDYKRLMKMVGMPNSRSLLEALKQCALEAAIKATSAEREACAKIAERYEPDEKADGVTYASTDIRARSWGG